jgi:hypothetical protein
MKSYLSKTKLVILVFSSLIMVLSFIYASHTEAITFGISLFGVVLFGMTFGFYLNELVRTRNGNYDSSEF